MSTTPPGAGPRPVAGSRPAEVPQAPPWWQTLRAEGPAPVRFALGAAFVAALLLFWWFLTRGAPTEAIVSPSKLPSPSRVFGSFGSLMDRGLIDAIIATLSRVFYAIALAAVVGVGLGVIAGSYRAVAAALMPLVIFLRSVPMGALIPVTVLCFGLGEQQKRVFLFMAVIAFVFSDTLRAIASVPERYVETAQTLGASRRQIITKVLLRLALPDIVSGLRFQIGLALGYVTLAEAVDASSGIGALINTSQQRGPYEHVYLALFVIALLAFGIDACLRVFQRQLFYYRKDL